MSARANLTTSEAIEESIPNVNLFVSAEVGCVVPSAARRECAAQEATRPDAGGLEYVAVEKEYIAVEKEIQKHPTQESPYGCLSL